ncbi:MAG: hypothetical protein IKA32_11085 [Lentisphaeria bacterium]|nr:hypothetical protein [Lentisphaeria bacterium]
MIAEKIKIYSVVMTAILLFSGCGHNIHVKGWGLASPWGAVGCGSFSCVKDNTTVEVAEKTPQMESKSRFVVNDQTTGYDIKALISCGQQDRSTPDQPEQKR